MTAITLPTGEVIAHDSLKRFHVVVAGRGRVSSSDERSRALSQWRRWRRNTPDHGVWLIDGETGGVVRGPDSPVHPAAVSGHDERGAA